MSLEVGLQILRDSYHHKRYKKVVALGRVILEMAPQSIEVKDMVKEAEMYVHLQRGRSSVVFSLLALLLGLGLAGVMTYQWFFVQPTIMASMDAQNQKYTGLVRENGEMKDKSKQVIDQMELIKSQISMLTVRVQNVADKMSRKRETRTDEKDTQIQGLQAKIDEQNNQIQKLINLTVTQVKDQQTLNYASDVKNILILGDHGGLTDTIMVASINPSLKTISFVSVPRDLYIDGRKINEIYRDFGVDTLEVYLHDITGLVIPNYVRSDLDGFKDVINALGGLDIYVDKAIEDNTYPTGDGNTEVFTLAAGLQHMDGDMALKYARTRHGDNDFERAKRQQKVIETVLIKMNAQGWTDLSKLLDFVNVLLSYVKSNVNVFQALGFYQDYKDFKIEGSNVLSTSNYLYSSKGISNDYILLPKDETYKEIQQFVYDLVMK